MIEGPGLLARLPVSSPELATTRYEALRVALVDDDVWASPRVVVFNPSRTNIRVRVMLLDQASGAELNHLDTEIASGAIWSRQLDPLLRRSFPGADLPSSVRLRLDGDAPFLAAGWVDWSNGEVSEIALFGGTGGHPTRTYPLPSLDRFEVEHVFVNLGDEPSEIVAQASADVGTYAIGPITVGPGASYTLNFRELVEKQVPDLLDRTLDANYSNGFFKWMARAGSQSVVARTEVTPLGARDSFGFNCYGCCYELPGGIIIPGSVDIGPGERPFFRASVSYETCDGPMGPFPTSPNQINAPSPFSWDGVRISASDGADEDVSFRSTEIYLKLSCAQVNRQIYGYGRARGCKLWFNPRCYSAARTCFAQTKSCIECNACCRNLYNQKICQGKRPDVALRERDACLFACLTGVCS